LHLLGRKSREHKDSVAPSLSRAAVNGANSGELAKIALLSLRLSTDADRLGVWLQGENSRLKRPVVFNGLVWDRGQADTPTEWQRLSPEYPLPSEVINSEASTIVDMDQLGDQPVFGPVVGMKAVLWMPVGKTQALSGLIMVASRQKRRDMFPNCQALASELTLALAYHQAHFELGQTRAELVSGQTLLPPASMPPGASPAHDLQIGKLAALGRMTANLEHELRNPLTTILGYARRLLKRDEISGSAGEIRQILHEAERAVKILQELQPSAREFTPRGKVSLNRVVLQTMEMQRLMFTAANIRTELNLDVLRPTIWGVADQLQQILVNLVCNARQAMTESGKGTVIRVRTKVLPGDYALLQVSDDGPGVPDRVADRIFDPFFTTKPGGAGAGLGLSIVSEIVREHSGQIHLERLPAGGARFSIEFRSVPAVATKLEWLSPAYSAEAASSPLKAHLQSNRVAQPPEPARVLVIEDELTVARLVADVLEEEGHRVDVALSAAEALQLADDAHYDLAICDMKMPDLDGEHFFRTLVREQNPLREKLLFVTGDSGAPHTRQFLEHNRLPFVVKPFHVQELSAAVSKVLARRSPAFRAVAPMAARMGRE
jgi:signal transduction histidine kinase/CheY-like chemotaxis protein